METRTSGSTGRGMLLLRRCLLGLAAQIAMPPAAAAHLNHPMCRRTTQLTDRQKEFAFSLSPRPASTADKVAVYVREASGYVKVQNGFMQSSRPLAMSQHPQCMDAEGLMRTLAVEDYFWSCTSGIRPASCTSINELI
jgi:hypothetical protein